MSDLALLKWRLTETIKWCCKRASIDDPENSLRSPELEPDRFDWQQTISERQATVDLLAAKRANFLRRQNRYPTEPAKDLVGGKLLIYLPEQSLSDGAAQANTNWFFDADNVPPWDTWLCYVHDIDTSKANQMRKAQGKIDWDDYIIYPESFLLVWVPPQMLTLIDVGITANPEHCIFWATDADTTFIKSLEMENLL